MLDFGQVFFYVDGIPTKGLWVDVDIYSDNDSVIELLAENGLCSEDYGGDLLVADAEGFARHYADKYTFDFEAFVEAKDIIERESIDLDAAEAYLELRGKNQRDFNNFSDEYRGWWQSEEDFVERQIDDCYEIPDFLQGYINYEKMARDWFISDYDYHEGHVFRNG